MLGTASARPVLSVRTLILAMSLIYLSREAWGARTDIPRLGGPEDPRGDWGLVPRTRRTHIINHHTVVCDQDATPNLWESLTEVKARMVQLQTIRPDLGDDVPYNFVWFAMADRSLLICEGRGYDRWGAHTAGKDDNDDWHNGAGIGIAAEGNFENYASDITPWMPALSSFYGHLRETMPNLGSLSPVRADTYGHIDFAQTACPGWHIYSRLPEIKIPTTEDEDMKPYLVREDGTNYIWITDNIQRTHLKSMAHAEALSIDTQVKLVPRGTLKSIPTVR